MYSITVSDSESLRKKFGLPDGVQAIDFDSGVIRVKDFKAVLGITDFVEIGSFKTELYDHLEIGSITRMKKDEDCIHLAILGIDNDNYIAAKVILSKYRNCKGIVMEKNIDVIYRNPTYKQYTVVSNDIFYNLKLHDFICSGGLVVGKIINAELLNKLIANMKKNLTLEEIINNVPDVEAFILHLRIDTMLEKAIILAVKMGTSNIRKLIVVLKKEYNITQTQKEVKLQIDSEYKELANEYPTQMNRSDFLKMIVKTF